MDDTLDNVVIDTFSRSINNPRPNKPNNLGYSDSILFVEVADKSEIFSTQFQVTKIVDDYVDLFIDVKRDIINIFYDTGKPDFFPIDLNKNVDIFTFNLTKLQLQTGQTFGFRVRFRNKNLQWSKWSE